MRLARIAAIALLGIVLVFTVACSLSSSSSPTTTPTYWVGPDGETEHEYVMCGVNCYYVGGDGEDIELFNNPQAHDPSWDELETFLASDKTDKRTYIDGWFVCADFTEMLHNNAEAAGIRAAFVDVILSSGEHACNAFNTTDEGLVYIDCTGVSGDFPCSTDTTVNIVVGNMYIAKSIFPCTGWSSTWDSIGIVTNVDIQW